MSVVESVRHYHQQESTGRFQTSIQLSPDCREYLFALARTLGISRTDVIEMAIRELGREILGEQELAALLDPTPLRPRAGRLADA